jgi:glycerol kinase
MVSALLESIIFRVKDNLK